jgi:hypothetical protein
MQASDKSNRVRSLGRCRPCQTEPTLSHLLQMMLKRKLLLGFSKTLCGNILYLSYRFVVQHLPQTASLCMGPVQKDVNGTSRLNPPYPLHARIETKSHIIAHACCPDTNTWNNLPSRASGLFRKYQVRARQWYREPLAVQG